MGRVYTASFQAVAKTAAGDLFELLVGSAVVAAIHEITITQSTEAGDAQAEMLRVSVERVTGSPTSGSGGTTPAMVAHSPGDAAAACVVEANNTTPLSGGTSVVLREEDFHVANGFYYQPIPEDRIFVAPSTRLMVKLLSTPGDSITFSGTITFEEIG